VARFLLECTRLNLLIPWRHLVDAVGFYIFTIFLFVGIAQVLTATVPAEDRTATVGMTLISYLFWLLYVATSHSTGMNISSHATQGLLERELVNPFGHLATILVWIGARYLSWLPSFFPILFGLAALYGVDVWTPLPALLLVMMIALPFLIGLGLIYAGLAFVYRHVSSVIGMLQFILFSAALGTHLPAGDRLEPVLTWFPYTQAIRLLSGVVVDKKSFSWLIAPEQIVPYVVTSVAVLVLGVVVFVRLDEVAVRRGTLGQA